MTCTRDVFYSTYTLDIICWRVLLDTGGYPATDHDGKVSKQVGQILLRLEIGSSLSYICIKGRKKTLVRACFFFSIRFPERKIKHMG